jgi:predicted RNA binding protein YcfA (HicA-like mRNA interferase family)
MRLPRDLSGSDLVKRLTQLRYTPSRQTGSHVRLTCDSPFEHHVTVPLHDALRVGTLAAIIESVSAHHKLSRAELLEKLFQ